MDSWCGSSCPSRHSRRSMVFPWRYRRKLNSSPTQVGLDNNPDASRSRWIRAPKLTGSKIQIRRSSSIDPLGEIIAALQLCCHLCWCHGNEFGQILSVFPLEELDAVLRVRLASEVAVSCRLLVLGFAEGQRLCDSAWPTIERNLDHVGDVICCELTLLCSIGLHEQRQGLRNTDCV